MALKQGVCEILTATFKINFLITIQDCSDNLIKLIPKSSANVLLIPYVHFIIFLV